VFDGQQHTIALDQRHAPNRSQSERCRALVENQRAWGVNAAPACDAGPQTEFRIFAVSEERFVEAADFVQHGTAVKSGTAIGPEHLLFAIVLAAIDFTGAAPTILPIGIHQMASFVDYRWVGGDQYFRCHHARRR